MKIPNRIKVAGHLILIKKSKMFKASPGVLGLAYMPGNQIHLSNTFDGESLPEATKSEVFLHEIIHHISDKYYVGLREKQVGQLASGLFQVIRDNKLDFRDRQDYNI